MKILFITNYFHPVMGGVENHVYNLSKELIKLGHSVEVWCSDRSRDNIILKNEDLLGKIKIRRFPALFKIGDFGVIFPGIFSELKNNNFDIIHVHVYRHIHNLTPLFTKTQCILTPHWPNYPKKLRSGTTNFLIEMFDYLLGKFILDKYKKILCITDLEKEWFIKKFKMKKSKLEIIPNGVSKKDLIKKEKNITKVKNVLSLGRQHKSKGFDQVIKIAKFFPDINFIIAGAEDNDTKRLKNLASKNTKILTNISEKQKKVLLKKADVFIHPSHYEGFGIVVLEAFANKIPVIASNKGGIPWVVDKAGLIFEDNNLKDLKNKLELLIKNNKFRKELSEKGYKRVKNFTWEKIVLDLEKTYNHTLFKFS